MTATVTHDFADRKYTSIEEDVIYLDARWTGLADREAERDLLPSRGLSRAAAAGAHPALGRYRFFLRFPFFFLLPFFPPRLRWTLISSAPGSVALGCSRVT